MTKQCLNDQRRSGGGPGREVFFVLGPREVDSALGASTLGTSRLCRSKQSNRAMLELKNREIILNYYRVNSCKKNAIIKVQPSPTQSNHASSPRGVRSRVQSAKWRVGKSSFRIVAYEIPRMSAYFRL